MRHVTALFFDFITVLANLISERRHNITIYEWERKSFHGNGHIYYELRPRAFYLLTSTFNAIYGAITVRRIAELFAGLLRKQNFAKGTIFRVNTIIEMTRK